jgi:hypothetical protein
MKKILILILFVVPISILSQEAKTYIVKEAQEKKLESKNSVSNLGFNKKSFGVQFFYQVKPPNDNDLLVSAQLKILNKKYSRDYYNSNDILKYKGEFKIVSQKITYSNKNNLLIPPLKPNRFYRVDLEYAKGIYLLHVFNAIKTEGKYLEKDGKIVRKPWMDMVDNIITVKDGKRYPLYFIPEKSKLDTYKTSISSFNLNSLSDDDKSDLRKKTLEQFDILLFEVPSDKNILEFAKKVKNDFDSRVTDSEIIFLDFFKINDYKSIYSFYEVNLMNKILNENLSGEEFNNLIVDELKKEIKNLKDGDPTPNYFEYAKFIATKENFTLTTYTDTFETAYKRVLVPDFGYVAFVGDGNNTSLNGGSPFVGINISLSPVNKNTPLRLSNLSFAQRFSIHTGVILESVKKENIRDDFFSGLSLMVGGSYKFLTQSTRINAGGILYNKIDAVTGSKSIAIQPYIGLSIDIEIRKWLSEVIPSFGNNFKN